MLLRTKRRVSHRQLQQGTACDGLGDSGTSRTPLSDPNVGRRFLLSPLTGSQLGKVWALLFKQVVQALKGKP